MPLLDHFHPPLHPYHHWESFYSNWATRIADLLNDRWLPPEYVAMEFTQAGVRRASDVATAENASPRPAPDADSDRFEVRVFDTKDGPTLVAAIALISPGDKGTQKHRRAFAAKCACYLQEHISLVSLDVVTNRRANLHNETMRLLNTPPETDLPPETSLYAVAYRPVLRQDRAEIDLWTAACAVGQPLPTMPLRLTGDRFVPVEF